MEEDIEKYIETSHYMNNDRKADIMFGIKLWQERSYSEEEVEEILRKREFDLKHKRDTKATREWFEKLKKK